MVWDTTGCVSVTCAVDLHLFRKRQRRRIAEGRTVLAGPAPFFFPYSTPKITVDKIMTPDNLQTTWSEISDALKEDVSEDTFDRWFRDVELIA
jgi:hypothetical protein